MNAILNLNGVDKIKDVFFEEKQLDVTLLTSEKLSILDIHVVTETDLNINVEIQLINQYNMIKRTIFYLSKMILSQLKKGEDYSSLNRTITINILNFSYLGEQNFINNYLYHNKTTKKILSDLCEVIFIELPKFNITHKDYNDKLHRWLTFLVNPSGEEIQNMAKTDGEIKEAMDLLYNISSDQELRRIIDLRELAIMDEQNRLNSAKKEGIEKGIEQGIEKEKENSRLKDIERVKKFLAKKFGTLNNHYNQKIESLNSNKLNLIIENILDIENLEDVGKYF